MNGPVVQVRGNCMDCGDGRDLQVTVDGPFFSPSWSGPLREQSVWCLHCGGVNKRLLYDEEITEARRSATYAAA